MDSHELGAVGKRRLDLHFGDHLRHAFHYVAAREDGGAEAHELRHAAAVARALEDCGALHTPAALREPRDIPVFVDRMRLSGASAARGAAWGLAGQEAVGTLLATPSTPAQLDGIRELAADFHYAAVSRVDGVLVLRALAPQAEAVRKLFIAAWELLRPGTIGREAIPPRIWST